MIYEFAVTLPAATAEASAVVTRMVLTSGIIHKLEVLGDGGEHGLVSLSIRQGAHQVWPTNPSGVLHPGWFPLASPVWYELEDPPYELVAYSWGPDTTNIHYHIIRLSLQRREVLTPVSPEAGIIRRLGQMLFSGGGRGP